LWLVVLVRERSARLRELIVWGPAPVLPTALGFRVAGLALCSVSLSLTALDLTVLRPRGASLAFGPLSLWAFGVPFAVLGLGLLVEGLPRLRRPDPAPLGFSGLILVAVGITWIVVSYFPHSNIPVVLPTVRAERFWYFPVIGSSLALAVLFSYLYETWKHAGRVWVANAIIVPFFLFQGVQAYRHAADYRSDVDFWRSTKNAVPHSAKAHLNYSVMKDYRSDVDFWRSTKNAVPHSAKAHLNYSVMKGARGDLPTRLAESRIAMALAPKWPMAHIYTGDTLCRMHRAAEAWPYYEKGFEIGPNDLSLIALALQCMYDEKELAAHDEALRAIADRHEGSWIAYLAIDTLANSEKNKGVDPKYRPRGYNEGPKE
jgi:hypothetical protein